MIKLLVDSTADLQPTFLEKHPEIVVIKTPIVVASKENSHEFTDLTPDDFRWIDHDYFRQGYRITTSSPPMMDIDFRYPEFVSTIAANALKEGYSVLYLAMGSGMSSTFAHASMAFDMLRDFLDVTEDRLQVIDTECMSTGTALLVQELCDHFDLHEVEDLTPLFEYVEDNRGHIAHFFTWTNLDYIVRSGRVGKAKGFAAKFLKLLPVGVSAYAEDGERKLDNVTSLNSPRSLSEFAQAIGYYAIHHSTLPKPRITIAHGNNPDAADYITRVLRDMMPSANIVSGYRLSSAIQVHGGPTSLHVNFHTDNAPTFEEMTDELADIMTMIRK